MAKATHIMTEARKYQVKEERKSFLTANIESNLHRQITGEAARNKLSFSAQIQEYKDKSIALEGTVDELRAEIKKITDVN